MRAEKLQGNRGVSAWRFRWICGVVLACFLAAWIPAPGLAEDAKPDQQAYKKHCALCHGEDGEAVDVLEELVEVEIPHLGSSYVQSKSDEEIRKVVTEGKGKMNPVKTIPEADVAGVIAFLRTFEEP